MLYPYHNTRHHNQGVHLSDYHKKKSDAGEMTARTKSELINTLEALHEAM